jgi:hypothetical protein
MFRSILLATLVSAGAPLGAVTQTADDLKNDDTSLKLRGCFRAAFPSKQ